MLLAAILVATSATAAAPASGSQPDIAVESVSVSADQLVAGDSETVTVTVANRQTSEKAVSLEEVFIRERGSYSNEDVYGRTSTSIGSISPGNSQDVPVELSIDKPGEYDLTVYATVEDDDGIEHRVSYPLDVTVTKAVIDWDISTTVQSSASGTEGDGEGEGDGNSNDNSEDVLAVDVNNFGTAPLEDAALNVTQGGEVIERALVGDIAAHSSATVEFDPDKFEPRPARFTLEYESVGGSYTDSMLRDLSDTLSDDIPGEIRLTGTETSQGVDGLTIQGEAANIGGTDVESVLVSVQNTERVSPTAPSGEYFVGSVDASEFATFELTADAQSEMSSVPIKIEYIVEDERVTTTQQVDIDAAGASAVGTNVQAAAANAERGPPGGTSGDGGLPLTTIGLAIAVLVIAGGGFTIYRWRNP
ncbi:CARDB domain-containing protein [Halopiger aswanensis]|uniref:CARDB domain-containing protein n=1 Tax=Halopiger aswanensis TaxID=148449 RepID=UPI0014739C88|nr:CARDB domain-containing protein [Halopiger aswanensis]